MSLIITTQFWTREEAILDEHTLYVFGDNTLNKGNAGQACVRGLENSLGIPTKVLPEMTDESFFDDDEHLDYIVTMLKKKENIIKEWILVRGDVVISAEIGRGLAELHERAPKCYSEILYFILKLQAWCNS